jgi:hypothetical protein
MSFFTISDSFGRDPGAEIRHFSAAAGNMSPTVTFSPRFWPPETFLCMWWCVYIREAEKRSKRL